MRVIPMTVQTPRRRVPRRAQRYQVNWAVIDINGKPARDSWVVDVSCMGARLDTTAALSPNTPVKFTIVLPDGETELVVNGRVAWMRPVYEPRPLPSRYPVPRHQLGPGAPGEDGNSGINKGPLLSLRTNQDPAGTPSI
jgi:hypothetical protein